jgi:hypothetical protein
MVAKRAQLTAVALAMSVIASLAATPATGADARDRGARPLARDRADAATAPIVNRILDRWHPVATVLHQDVAVWRAQFGAVLARASIATLQAIDAVDAKAGSVNRSLLQQYQQAYSMAVTDVGAQIAKQMRAAKGAKLGSPTTDLVFVGFTPCRIVDTRVSGQGISAQTQRSFYFYSDGTPASWGTAQGGDPGATQTACPNTTLTAAGGTLGSVPPAAAVATVTAVNTTAAGNFVVWGGGPPTSLPNVSALNWDHAGQIIANTTVIPWGGRTGGNQDFTVRYNGPTGFSDVVVDVIGYFIENEATALDCTSTETSGPITIGTGVDTTISYPACAAGYTRTGGYCNGGASTGTSGVYLIESGEAACVFRNLGGSGGTVAAISRCCRVPGR